MEFEKTEAVVKEEQTAATAAAAAASVPPPTTASLPSIPSPRYTSPRDLPIRLSELVRIVESEQKPGATKV